MLWVTNTTVMFLCCVQMLQIDVELIAGQRVERAERLVHQQQPRIEQQRAAHRNALPHSARQRARIAVHESR